MTSRHSARSLPERAAGFTLIELMVTVMIMAILAAGLVVVVGRANKAARRTRVQGDLQAIATALEAYKQDFGDYPRPRPGDADVNNCARLLCRALVGPGDAVGGAFFDGANGPGFRVRAGGQGRVYGPYINLDRFHVDSVNCLIREGAIDPLNPNTNDHPPILYFPAAYSGGATPKVSPEAVGGFVTNLDTSLYNSSQNSALPAGGPADGYWVTPANRLRDMRLMLGDRNTNGQIDSGVESPACTGPFLLWTTGSDGMFGLRQPTPGGPYETDDIANFDVDPQIVIK